MVNPDADRLTLVLMAGPPGAGKTTLGLAVSRALGWPVVDKDTLKSSMLTAGVPEGIAGRTSYELMFDVGADLLIRQGFSVVLDSPAGYPQVIDRAEELARKGGAELRFVLCLARHGVRNERLARRNAGPPQWTSDTAILDDGSGLWLPLLPPYALQVCSEEPVDVLIQEVLEYLRDPEFRRDIQL